jgi:hypothetical protein
MSCGLAYSQLPTITPGLNRLPFFVIPTGNRTKLVFKQAKLVMHLKNDSTVTLKAEFDAASKQNVVTIRSLNGTPIKIYKPADTKLITRKLPGGGDLEGIPADSCWLFKIIDGKISGYSNVPAWSEERIIAFSLGSGNILPLTKENFQAIESANDKNLVRFIRKEKWLEAIHYYNRYVK